MGLLRQGALLGVLLAPAVALAQPADPYGPAPAPTPPAPTPAPVPAPTPPPRAPAGAPGPPDPYAAPAQDPVLAEQIAEQLVARSQELFDARSYQDAKQLAVEALVEAPKGLAADRARALIKQVNQRLGITDESEPEAPAKPPTRPPDLRPLTPTIHVPEQPAPGHHDVTTAARVHGAIYGGMLGAAIGSLFSSAHPAAGAVPVGLGLAVGGAFAAPKLADHWHLDEAQVRTVGSGSLWGGVIGGMFADVVSGGNGGHATAQDVLVGSGLGATAGLAGGAYLAHEGQLTRGDVALIDTFAGMGTAGGLTLGMLMQPAQPEAYSLNAALGAAAGIVVGIVAAPQTNTTPRRMLRVAGMAALGGALPMTILLAGPGSSGVQRAAGGLATLGLVGGAWLGFYLTRDMDAGLDVPDGQKPADDAPPAVIGRDSSGRWHLGGLALSPLSPRLSSDHGMALNVLGGAF